MQVKDLMSTDVVSVKGDTSINDVAKLMKQMNIGSIPVCDNNKVVGIVTDRDIVVRDIAMEKSTQDVLARDIMTPTVSTISSNADIHDAAKIMSDKQIRRLPVVDNGKLVGMLAIGDMAVNTKLEDNAGEALSDISKPTNKYY